MFGTRILPIMCSTLLLASCSGTDLLGSLGDATSKLFVPSQSDAGQAGDFIATEDEAYNLQLQVRDVDIPYGDKLTFSMVALPDWLSLSRDGMLKGTPKNADVGLHEITVRVTDRSGQTDDATLLLTVRNTNDNPKFVTTSLPRAVQDQLYEIQIEVADDDIQHGDVKRFKAVSAPDWITLSKDGMLSGTPANADVGEYMLAIEVADKAGVAVQKEFKINVENINDAPVFITKKK